MTKNQRPLFVLALGFLVVCSLALGALWASFDDEVYIFEGVSRVYKTEVYDVLEEKPGEIILLEDLDPADNWVHVTYSFEIDYAPDYPLNVLEYRVERDANKWAGLAMTTVLIGGIGLACLVSVIYLGLGKKTTRKRKKKREKKGATTKGTTS